MFPVNRRSYVRPFALIVLIALTNIAAFTQTTDDLSPEVRQQIAEILEAKRSFNVGERKIASRLVFANRKARLGNRAIGKADASLINTSMVDAKGMVEVEIHGIVTSALLSQIRTLGGQVENSSVTYGTILARVPIKTLDQIAARSEVRSVIEPGLYMLNSRTSAPSGPGQNLLNSLLSLRAGYASLAGSLMSQGYIAHRVNQVPFAINGTGVKVGVISDSASAARVAALITSGDLGAGTTVLEASAGTDEGTAMMEIVQDMAPGAQIYFATANGGEAHMAANIAALQAAGCTIIVDDITYFAEAAFQDGPIAQAVNTFVAGGGLYFSSAGNSGNVTLGTSGTWEGDYLDGGAVSGPIATAGETGNFHNFGTPGSPQNYDVLQAINASRVYSLKWSDPLGASSNDYDLFVLNSTGTTLKDFSAGVQSGTQDPVEIFQGDAATVNTIAVNDRMVVVNFDNSAAPRALRLDAHRGRLSISTVGATFAHNAAQNTVTVAATAWNSANVGTAPFSGGAPNPVEIFNSDGPRKIFYNPNGTPITPGNFLFGTNGGTNVSKPDITAADGVVTKTPGFNPFFGTSAAAPHAAGIAALIKSAKPTATNAQIIAILKSTALDNMAAGVDRDGGSGIIMAFQAVQAALLLP